MDSKKPHSSIAKSHKHQKDLWVSTVKDFNSRDTNNMSFSTKFHDSSINKGRIHRGASFKGDEKPFSKNHSFD